EFFGNCLSRRVSRKYRDATWFAVLAWRSHVELRWPGMARPVRAGINLFPRSIIQQQYNSPADYARPAWRTLDVCARSALCNPTRCDPCAWRLPLEHSDNSKGAAI